MATATLTRGNTEVEIVLLEQGGSPILSRDIGKPTLNIHETGALDPRHVDQQAGLMQYSIAGRLVDNGYQQAIELADLLKSHSNGSETLLNISMPEYDTDVTVVPAAGQQQAMSLAYNPGRRDWVDVDIGLTRVSQFNSGSVGSDQIETTPTASGSGPIELSYQGSTVELVEGVTVERTIGRHNSDTTGNVPFEYPIYQEKAKTAYDAFEIQTEFTENTITRVNNLVDMFTTRLGRNSLTLDFNGVYGLGSFNVVPDGSNALRHTRVAGEQGTGLIPTINVRRVFSDG